MNLRCIHSLLLPLRPLAWLVALATMPAWSQPTTQLPLALGDHWALYLQAEEHFEGTLAMHLAPTLQAGATVALQPGRDMSAGQVPERVAVAWTRWKLQPGWTLSAALRHAGRGYADRAHVWSLPAYTRADVALHWQAGADSTLALLGFEGHDGHSRGPSHCTTGQPHAVKRLHLKLGWKCRF